MERGEATASSQTISKSLIHWTRDNLCLLDRALGEISLGEGEPGCGERIHSSEGLGKSTALD